MKVSILTTQGTFGGAARAALRLHIALIEKGVESRYLAKKTIDNVLGGEELCVSRYEEVIEKLIQVYYVDKNRTELSDTYYSFNYGNAKLNKTDTLANSDIINLHWVDKFIGDKALMQLVELNKPIVWTLHDEKPFTGGCHYTAGCRNFEQACKPCPQLAHDPFDLSYRALKSKLEVLSSANLTVVSPSVWLAEQAKRSALFKNCRVEVIPNSIETDLFAPVDKELAKKRLGIKPDSITIMFGAHDNKSKRKGFFSLMEAINICLLNDRFRDMCDSGEINIVTVGMPNKEIEQLPITVHKLGFVDDDKKMAEIYSATNLFVLPSLEDNLPNTMLESFACATPVVGYSTGGIPDFVKNGENGYVVPKGDSQNLADAIMNIVFDPEKARLFGLNGRSQVESSFKFSDQAGAYCDLFNDIIKNQSAKKKVTVKLDRTRYDALLGYSYRKSVENAPDIGDMLELYSCVQEIAAINMLREPIRKIRAYRRMISIYKRSNHGCDN